MKMFKYARVCIFKKLLLPFSSKRRKERMASFVAIMKPFEGMKIVDLGGTPEIWKLVEIPLDITIVNLPGLNDDEEVESHHRITFVEGDACDEGLLAGSNFQMAFSNSGRSDSLRHLSSLTRR